jgi:hypothetical protein
MRRVLPDQTSSTPGEFADLENSLQARHETILSGCVGTGPSDLHESCDLLLGIADLDLATDQAEPADGNGRDEAKPRLT